ncbi:S9 family peptidase [Sphingomonas sp. SM33]|uniref:S9 family peptidase n=1 Tax=Sphingomonas telluris TaxID=2907998 RepID=A0ABS9VR72_9SPHN|nr:S9 family peptidase [Sphingomonas telluris]MCH8617457.1 S9 family peptidase [Sphingomonas telluris]
MLRTYVAALLLAVPAAAATRPFTAKDLASIERVSAPSISPDGRYVAYALRTTDWDGNKGVNALNVIDLQGDTTKPLALLSNEKAGPGASWSSDGRWLYFISGKSGSAQVWRSSADGSVRQQLTSFPIDVAAFKLAPDGRTLIVAASVYPDCPTLACTKDRADAKAKAKGSGLEIKTEPRFWDSYLDQTVLNLFRVDVGEPGAPAEGTALIKGFTADVPADGDSGAITLSHDGRTVYFASRDPASDRGGGNSFSKIYVVAADGKTAPRLLIDRAGTSFSSPAVSPDGRSLAYVAVTGPLFSFARTAVMLMDLRSGKTREVAPGFDAALGAIAWSADGKSLLATGQERGQAPLYRIDLASNTVTKFSGEGVVSAFDSAGESTVFIRDTLGSPQQLFVQQGAAAPRQLTNAGASILSVTPLSPSEQFSFAGWNGETVYGYITKPYGFVEGRKYPVAFLIHGGPQSSFSNAWSYRWNPQVWAGMGYAVVTVDFHGSTGYGEKFAQSITGHWGDRPLEDLQKGWAHALANFAYLDGSRACALGGSYGGYMINWIASQWSDPWKCLVNHAGVFDVRSQAWVMDVGSFVDVQFGSTGNIADWEGFNPAVFSNRWKKPMLVVHGGKDFRVPTEQGIAAYNAARRAGVPTELLVFPDENHWVLKPQNSVQWYRKVEDWMDRWTGNVPPTEARQASSETADATHRN